MKESKFKIYLFLPVILFFGTQTFAQSATVAAGGECTGAGGTVSYSVGQIDYITAQGSGGIMTEGVQQPFEIYTLVGVDEMDIDLTMAVFPNPARDLMNLQIDRFSGNNMSFKLYDNAGNLVLDQKITGKQTQIDLSGLALATYLLQVYDQGNELKTFKIIKNI